LPVTTVSLRRVVAPPLLALILSATGCSGERPGAEAANGRKAAARAPTVTVAAVEVRAVERQVDATGSLLAWEEAVVNTTIPGRIARLLVDLGDRVRPGQVVAEMDPRELDLGVEQAQAVLDAARDALARARAQVEASEAQLTQVRESRRALVAALQRTEAALEETRVNQERTATLADQALVAQRDVDVARTQYVAAQAAHETAQVELSHQFPARIRVAESQLQSDRSAVRVAESELRRREADLSLARKRLADLTLRASISGAVARRHLNAGQYVSENTAVFTLVRGDPLKFTGTVPEHAALAVHPGQVVRVRVEPLPDRQFQGRVVRVSPSVDVTSRTVQMEAEVANSEGLLKPGLFVRASVVLRHDQGVPFVPEAAVSYFAGITRVFVVSDSTVRERTVTLGAREEGLVEVVKGVAVGERVATSGLAQLQDGAAVTVAPRGSR
jgi:RND family efflux transporter MFP subunit